MKLKKSSAGFWGVLGAGLFALGYIVCWLLAVVGVPLAVLYVAWHFACKYW